MILRLSKQIRITKHCKILIKISKPNLTSSEHEYINTKTGGDGGGGSGGTAKTAYTQNYTRSLEKNSWNSSDGQTPMICWMRVVRCVKISVSLQLFTSNDDESLGYFRFYTNLKKNLQIMSSSTMACLSI